jgi:sulfide:quinone oxidoreductase
VSGFRAHDDDLRCSAQITAEQVSALAAAGYRTIICNRPDEEDGAVASSTIAEAARAHGMAFIYQPVRFSSLSAADGACFAQALDASPPPVLAYCRTGRRSAALWVMARAPRLGVDAALAASKASGFELEELRPRLAASHEQ